MADINELKAVLAELDQLFDRDDDINDLFDISKMRREIAAHSQHSLRDAKELIKALTADVAKKETEIMAPSKTEHEAALKRAADKENMQQRLDNLLRDIDAKRTHILKLTESTVAIQERTQEFKISNITWNYEAPAGHLAGCIGHDQQRLLRSFDLETTGMSDFEVTNSLWEMIEQSHTATASV